MVLTAYFALSPVIGADEFRSHALDRRGSAPSHRGLAMAALQRSPLGRLAAQRGLPVLYR
jgi:hypothetical protein